MNLWNEYRASERFKHLAKTDQDRLIKLAMSKEVADWWYGNRFIKNIINNTDKKTASDVLYSFILHASSPRQEVQNLITRYKEIDEAKTQEAILKNKSNSISKMILIFSNISLEEEILGLRALSTSKYSPKAIYDAKYTPSYDALLKLPSIMRLKTIEALCDIRYAKYNMFKNVSDEQFNNLLFPSVMRYRDRVERLTNQYKELIYMGVPSKVSVSGECEKCGKFEIAVSSSIMRTESGLKRTMVGRCITRHRCPFCYGKLLFGPNFKVLG
jgi:hypothetical protein